MSAAGSTSGSSSCAPSSCSSTGRTSWPATRPSFATCWSTSSRTPTWPRSCCSSWSGAGRASRTTSSWSATTTSRSTASAAPASPPSSASASASRRRRRGTRTGRAAGGRQPLLENRRSTGHILSAAQRLIEHNARRLKSEPLRPTPDAGDGRAVEVVYAADEADEADHIVGWIERAHEQLPEPRRWSDIAVLYRKHRHRDQIVERLRKQGIPYVVVGGTGLFAQPDVRDVEAALRVAPTLKSRSPSRGCSRPGRGGWTRRRSRGSRAQPTGTAGRSSRRRPRSCAPARSTSRSSSPLPMAPMARTSRWPRADHALVGRRATQRHAAA
jgi:hypothetical protein